MESNRRYTVKELEETLDHLAAIFDVVRIVDPRDTAVLSLNENGTLRRETYQCFQVWNKTCRCKNCTSIDSAARGCQRSKYEFVQNDVFYMMSRPLTLVLEDGELVVVLEIVNHVSDQLLTEEDGKTITERLEDLQEKLYRDDLTRAFNRRYLSEFTFLRRGMDFQPRRLGLVMLDLRRFKAINDTLGHLAGDQVLEAVTRALASHVRSKDAVIRLGGDEFVVTLPDCDEGVLHRKVEELRTAVNEVAEADFGYSYTDCFEMDPAFLKRMLDEADQRMYEEKRRYSAN